MKKTFTLLAAMLLTVISYAYPKRSTITISSNTHATIRVVIDGSRYRTNNNSVVINDLDAGYHTVKVYRLKTSTNSVRNNSANNNYQLVYNSNIYVKPLYHVDIVINRFGKAFFDEQPIAEGYYDNNDDDWGDDNASNNWNNNNDHNTHRPMNTQSFDRFKASLKNENFDNTRMNIARQVISANWFNTGQVKEIMSLFSFESNKLDLAKYAFQYTTNKGDYFMLADEFSFSSNKDELMKYIQANK